MNAPIDTSRRPAPEVLAAVLGELATRFGERAVVNASVREQHGHGEGLADAALPDVVVFPHTNEEVAAIVKICAVGARARDRVRRRHVARGPRRGDPRRRVRRPLADEQGAGDQRRGPRLPRAGGRVARAAERGAQGHRRLLPDRPGRERDAGRHGRDARVGHERGALRHDARERAGPHGRHRRRPDRPDRRSGAQVVGRLRPHAALRRQRGHAGDHHRGGTAALRRARGDLGRGRPVPGPAFGRAIR